MAITTEKIYVDVNELIANLKSGGDDETAKILHHRMCNVSWTTSSELLEELQLILEKYISEHKNINVDKIIEKMSCIVTDIKFINAQKYRKD